MPPAAAPAGSPAVVVSTGDADDDDAPVSPDGCLGGIPLFVFDAPVYGGGSATVFVWKRCRW